MPASSQTTTKTRSLDRLRDMIDSYLTSFSLPSNGLLGHALYGLVTGMCNVIARGKMAADRKVSTRIHSILRSLCELISLRLVPGHHSNDAIDTIWDRWIKQDCTKYLSTILVALTDLANNEISNPLRVDDASTPVIIQHTSRITNLHVVVHSCNSLRICRSCASLGRGACPHDYRPTRI
jgi:hypothetical protein